MATSYDVLDDALRKIKEECESHQSCRDCPFSIEDTHCGITTYHKPENWKLISDDGPVARLFK